MFKVRQWKQTILNINTYSNNVYLLKKRFYSPTLYGVYMQI